MTRSIFMRCRGLLGAVALLTTHTANSADPFRTGTEFLRLCKGASAAGPAGASACSAFVVGAAQGLNVGHDIGRLNSKASGGAKRPKDFAAGQLLCYPRGASPDQLTAPVVAFLEGNPDKRHLEAIALVQAALIRAFPCQAFQPGLQPLQVPKPGR